MREAVETMIEASRSSQHTQMPGRVESYDQATQRASVQPLIKRGYRDEDGVRQTDTLPVITDVPIVFMGTRSESLTCPIAKGDLVWIQFSEVSIDRWASGDMTRVTDPGDDRRFTLNDAVAFPWAMDADVASGAWVLNARDIRLGSSGANDPVALKSDLAALKTWIDLHTHLGVLTGGGVSGTPATAPSPTPSGASRVKAE